MIHAIALGILAALFLWTGITMHAQWRLLAEARVEAGR